jgi:hypothetical protein
MQPGIKPLEKNCTYIALMTFVFLNILKAIKNDVSNYVQAVYFSFIKVTGYYCSIFKVSRSSIRPHLTAFLLSVSGLVCISSCNDEKKQQFLEYLD